MRPHAISLTRPGPQLPWGFAITGGGSPHDPPIVSQITQGSPAERQGLQMGDELLQIGKTNVTNLTCDQIYEMVMRIGGDRLAVMVLRQSPATPTQGKKKMLIHNPYNSPMGLYSEDNVNETIAMHARALGVNPSSVTLPDKVEFSNGTMNGGPYADLGSERYILCPYKPETPLPPPSPPRSPPPPKLHPLTENKQSLKLLPHQALYFKTKTVPMPVSVVGTEPPSYTGPAQWPPPAYPARHSTSPQASPTNVRRMLQKVWPPKHSSAKEYPKSGFLQSTIVGHPDGKKFIWPPPRGEDRLFWSPPPSLGARNAWNPGQTNGTHCQRIPSPSPRRRDIAWPPPPSASMAGHYSAPPSPSSRRRAVDDRSYIQEYSGSNLPPTYRPPPFVPAQDDY